MSWTLQHNGVTQSLADWGIHNLNADFVNQGTDQVTFDVVVETIETNTAFSFGDTVRIFDPNGAQWFEGTVIQTPLTALPGAETHGYVVAGPWWHFEENTFKQPWISNSINTVYTGHLLLNLGSNGFLLTVAQQIDLILDYLLSIFPAGAKPFQKGIIEPNALPPVNEINGYSCAAAMRAELRWVPEGVTWFDYTTSPPTLHIRARANLTAVSLPIPGQDNVRLVPRYDIQRPSVHIQFERITVLNGKNYLQVLDDIYPTDKTGQEPRALSIPLSLAGPTTTLASAELFTDPILPDEIGWWKRHHEPLRDPRIAGISVVEWARKIYDEETEELVDSTEYEYELVEGQIAEWMNVAWEQEIITGVLNYKVYDRDATETGAVLVEHKTVDIVTINLVATEAPSGVYQTATTEDTGDPIPVGLAQYLYEQLSVLHFDGAIRLVEQEPTGQAKMGHVVNIPNGRAEWANMRGLVQRVTVNVDRGETTVIIGPPNHLGPSDLMELLRVGRRFRWTSGTTQSTGEIGASGRLQLGQPTANTNTHNNGPVRSSLAIKSGEEICNVTPPRILMVQDGNIGDGATGKVDINTADLPAGLNAKFRETIVCVIEDGQQVSKSAWVLMTPPA